MCQYCELHMESRCDWDMTFLMLLSSKLAGCVYELFQTRLTGKIALVYQTFWWCHFSSLAIS
jgi:hypothetical protein